MATWPAIRKPSVNGIKETVHKPIIQTETDGNYISTRLRATRHRHKWVLSWEWMEETSFQTLEAFFLANQGLSFTWVHPSTSTSYTCVFSSDSIESNFINYNWRSSVSVQIEEL